MFALEENHPSRRRPLRIAVALLSALALAGVSALALRHGASPKPVVLVPQATTNVVCGQQITASIVVGNDINCSSLPGGNGLNVRRANITINLNGHTLAITPGNGGVGVFVAAESSGARIENGTVSGWDQGVRSDAPLSKVTAVRATASVYGIFLLGVGSSATGDVAFGNSRGIVVAARNAKVTSDVVRENGFAGIVVSSVGALVQTNQAENNGQLGIDDESLGTTLTGNVTNANGADGIKSAGDQTAIVASNTANYNGAYGIEASPGGKDGGGNTAKGNVTAAQCKDVVCS